ncbi:hypothetical protein [Micromonospora sp. WMMD736]|uniref:hypothetical protein n=1 Tax=Micromonospora sp. WMMD736 TaxID=3404112 RepID=UPI003B948C12
MAQRVDAGRQLSPTKPASSSAVISARCPGGAMAGRTSAARRVWSSTRRSATTTVARVS